MKAKASDYTSEETLDLNHLTSSELSSNLEPFATSSEFCAFSMVNGKISNIALDEMEEGDYLLPPSFTEEASERIRNLSKRRLLRYDADEALVISGMSLFAMLISMGTQNAVDIADSSVFTVIWNAFNGLLGLSFVTNILYSFISPFEASNKKSQETNLLAEGVLSVPAFKRVDGTAYEVASPSHEELYDAILKLGEVSALKSKYDELTGSLEKLKMRVKSPRVQSKVEETLTSLSETRERLETLEREIQQLLTNS